MSSEETASPASLGPHNDAPESPAEQDPEVGDAQGPSETLTPEETLGILQTGLGYVFGDPSLLETALTHKSWANEHGPDTGDYERLEFLGDALFSLVVAHLFMHRYPEVNEGVLSRARAALVSTTALADLATELGLGASLRLGRGEARTGGRTKPSILADACEAMAAAIYLDGGFGAALTVLGRLLKPRLEPALQTLSRQDPKTHLQERIQALTKRPPTYILKDTIGPLHELEFIVVLRAADRDLAEGVGRTKKDAEQQAAAQVLTRLRAGASLAELLGLSSPATASGPVTPEEAAGNVEGSLGQRDLLPENTHELVSQGDSSPRQDLTNRLKTKP